MEDMEAPLNAVAIEVSQKSPKDPVMKETMRMVFLGSDFSTLLTSAREPPERTSLRKFKGNLSNYFFLPIFLSTVPDYLCPLFFPHPFITVISIEVDPFFSLA